MRFKGSDFDIAEGTPRGSLGREGKQIINSCKSHSEHSVRERMRRFIFHVLPSSEFHLFHFADPDSLVIVVRVRESGFFHDPKWNRYLWPLRHWPRPIKSNPLDFLVHSGMELESFLFIGHSQHRSSSFYRRQAAVSQSACPRAQRSE